MNKPYQQGGEAQRVKIELAPATARGRQAVPMDPDPDSAQESGDADKQHPQQGIAGGGFNPGLMERAVTGLDAKALPVDLVHPVGRRGGHAPAGMVLMGWTHPFQRILRESGWYNL